MLRIGIAAVVAVAAADRCGYGKKGKRLASTARSHPSLWVSGGDPCAAATLSSMGEWRCWNCAGLAGRGGRVCSAPSGGRGWMGRRGVVSQTWRWCAMAWEMGWTVEWSGSRGSDVEVCCDFAESGTVGLYSVDFN